MREEIIRKIESLDTLSHVDVVYMLENSIGNVLYYDETVGLAIRHPVGTVFAIPFSHSSSLAPLYDAMGKERLYCLHSEEMCRHYIDLGYDFKEPCYTYSYHGASLDEGPYKFRLMRLDEMDLILSHYDSTEKSIKYDIEHNNLFCIEDDGAVMGFCGFHSEGAMGLLVVFPEYRKKGIGTYMESFVINEALRRGVVPFCNVYISNKASIKLQSKLGLIAGKVLSYWVWND